MEDGKTQLTFLTVIEMLQNIPRRKKLTVSELEKSGTGDHQSILFFFFWPVLVAAAGCCWLLTGFQVFVLCYTFTGCLPVASFLALGIVVEEMVSFAPNFYF